MPANTEQHFYGHGKLMLTGEYFVLDGAQALAVPTVFGQHLRVKELTSQNNLLYWVALDNAGHPWLQVSFDKQTLDAFDNTTPEAQSLARVLKGARSLNPHFLTDTGDVAVETRLEFPRNWGLGSSSTLIHTVSCWAGVNGYELLQATLGGSGYDVACAASDSAILFTRTTTTPEVIHLHWQPPFAGNLFFVHLGHKQNSAEGIKYYREQLGDKTHLINELNRITSAVFKTTDMSIFSALLQEHERLVGDSLKMICVKERLFPDYPGLVKSLGAWGGDFVLFTAPEGEAALKEYLNAKNYRTVLSWNDMIFKPA